MTAATVSEEALWDELWAALDQFVADAVTSSVPAPIVRAMQSPDAAIVTIAIDGIPATVPIQAGPLTPDEVVSAWQDLRARIVADRMEAVS